MLHHLAGATIQVANLVNYNFHPQEDGNKFNPQSQNLPQNTRYEIYLLPMYSSKKGQPVAIILYDNNSLLHKKV